MQRESEGGVGGKERGKERRKGVKGQCDAEREREVGDVERKKLEGERASRHHISTAAAGQRGRKRTRPASAACAPGGRASPARESGLCEGQSASVTKDRRRRRRGEHILRFRALCCRLPRLQSAPQRRRCIAQGPSVSRSLVHRHTHTHTHTQRDTHARTHVHARFVSASVHV